MVRALSLAKQIQFTGLPARICWLGYGERPKAALKVNEMIAAGEVVGPVSFPRDHLDAGGASTEARERGRAIGANDTLSGAASVVLPLIAGPLVAVAGLPILAVVSTALVFVPVCLVATVEETNPGRPARGMPA